MIEIKNISKKFRTEGGDIYALKDVSLNIADGDVYGIIGVSGAGKSTLVRCINMLEKPSEGTVCIDGVDMSLLSEKQLREKRKEIAMIFQGFNLLMQRNCLKNVCFPMELAGINRVEAEKKAIKLLELVGLKDKAYSYPSQLSGGQKQRVAIARALANDPKLLLCDEATSALDPTTTNQILELIREINQKLNITVIVITHQMNVVESICRHVAILDNGVVAEKGPVGEVFSHPKSEATKRLVFPEGSADNLRKSEPDEHIIRLVFNGAKATNTPMIARLALEKGIEANITYASTKSVDDKVYGYMLLGIKRDSNIIAETISYFMQMPDVYAEEVFLDD
ncbi:MAG: ATP-binding cassette domain-containing protein [Erysipelotrichaceae bacterium]|nr:ATP-binding cassette domain-containing protein [Erysipelotrichaceae bacterium]